jgi:chromate transport protein ChrA
LPNFLIVAGLGALYVHFGVLQPVTAIFYGVSPVVIALILHSCYRLAKLGMHEHGWLGEREFLIAVAIGMISPGPVVITATFVGYLVAGFWGALTATIGIFLPSFLLGAVKPISHR